MPRSFHRRPAAGLVVKKLDRMWDEVVVAGPIVGVNVKYFDRPREFGQDSVNFLKRILRATGVLTRPV
jgi:hypothetical protein